MRIAIDARWIYDAPSGIGIYTRELAGALIGLKTDEEFLLIFRSARVRDRIAAETGLASNPRVHTALVPWSLFSLANQLRMPGWLRARGVALFHSTNYMLPLAAFPRHRRGRIAGVVTIHDVIPLIFPDYAPKARKRRLLPFYRLLMREVGMRADRIITVSNTSGADIVAQLGVAPEKVAVVYNGIGRNFKPSAAPRRARADDEPRQLLYVGRADPYKNLVNLVRAFAILRRTVPFPVKLTLVGAIDPRYPEAKIEADRAGLGDALQWIGALPGGALADAYRAADLFVLPSRYEGFGIPAAEAMACGTPVICGDCGALREVGGDAVRFVDPDDIDAMAATMRVVLTNDSLAAMMAQRGLEQVRRFDWHTAARQTMDVYHAAATL